MLRPEFYLYQQEEYSQISNANPIYTTLYSCQFFRVFLFPNCTAIHCRQVYITVIFTTILAIVYSKHTRKTDLAYINHKKPCIHRDIFKKCK